MDGMFGKLMCMSAFVYMSGEFRSYWNYFIQFCWILLSTNWHIIFNLSEWKLLGYIWLMAIPHIYRWQYINGHYPNKADIIDEIELSECFSDGMLLLGLQCSSYKKPMIFC